MYDVLSGTGFIYHISKQISGHAFKFANSKRRLAKRKEAQARIHEESI